MSMSTPLSVGQACSHCDARAVLSLEMERELRDLACNRPAGRSATTYGQVCFAVIGVKRRSCTSTERNHRASLERTREPKVEVAGGLGAGDVCAAQTHENPHSVRLARKLVILHREQFARFHDPSRLHHPHTHLAPGASGESVAAFSMPEVLVSYGQQRVTSAAARSIQRCFARVVRRVSAED
jgi:hypothetical protein